MSLIGEGNVCLQQAVTGATSLLVGVLVENTVFFKQIQYFGQAPIKTQFFPRGTANSQYLGSHGIYK